MQVVSSALITFLQHYLVAMVTSLDKLENKIQVHHLHLERYHILKRLQKFVQYVRRYSTKSASFLAMSYLSFTNKLCQLWSYSTEFHESFTRYRGIIYAVNPHIDVAISHYVSSCQSDKCREIGNFATILPQIWLPWQRPLNIGKRRSD